MACGHTGDWSWCQQCMQQQEAEEIEFRRQREDALRSRIEELEGHIRNVAHRHAQLGAAASDPSCNMSSVALTADLLDDAIEDASHVLEKQGQHTDTAGGDDGE